jgi:sigma-B regulation protein RsbU (phosphoserine phosphatase)
MTPIRVLIADHDELLLENYTAFFREISWETAVATSGLQCVEQLRTFRPDVLVLEPELPWGGGAGVLAEMHGVSGVPLAPVMILTAGRDKDELTRVFEYQVDEFQLKPLNADELARKISWLLNVTISQ